MKMWNGEIIHGSQKGWDLSYTYNRALKKKKSNMGCALLPSPEWPYACNLLTGSLVAEFIGSH